MVLPSNLPSFINYNNSNVSYDNYLTDMSMSNYYTNMLYNVHNLNDVSQNSINLERNSEVSAFYLFKYNKQIYLLKLIIFVCCIALIGCIIYNYGIMPSNMFTIYLGVVFAIGGILVLYNLFDIYVRDNHNFNEYDQLYKPPLPNSVNTSLRTYTTQELANMEQSC
jgi:uncharacterized membrane protein (DUF485 family)